MLMLFLGSAGAAAQEPRRTDPPNAVAVKQISGFIEVLRRAVESGAGAMTRQVGLAMRPSDILNGPADVFGYRLDDANLVFHVGVPSMRSFSVFTWRVMATTQSQMVRPVASGVTGASLPPQPAPYVDRALVDDPDAAYTREVRNALVNAMVEQGAALRIGPDEWLTVTARANAEPDPASSDPQEESHTLVFRIRGSDLAAVREGRITLDEGRKRVTMRQE
jgi:hypothetical protein